MLSNMIVKVVLWFSLCISLSVGSYVMRYEIEGDEGDEDPIFLMVQPNGRGNLTLAVLNGMEPVGASEDTMQFILFTRDNPKEGETLGGDVMYKSSISSLFKSNSFSHFKPDRVTKILVHGFSDCSEDSIMFPLLKDAYLESGDYNVLYVDWGKLAAAPWYLTAARNTDRVGKRLAEMIDFLAKTNGAKTSDMTLIGFSLGAHVAGAAGKYVKSGRIGRIVGLDPALVLFTNTPPDYRLDPADAEMVEVVHTSAGYLGFTDPIGHRDFYPNGGSWPQPGCPIDYAAVCSHRRAYYYYAEAVKTKSGFRGYRCENYVDFVRGSCKKDKTQSIEMINSDKDTSLTGKFFFSTNAEEPYGTPIRRRHFDATKAKFVIVSNV